MTAAPEAVTPSRESRAEGPAPARTLAARWLFAGPTDEVDPGLYAGIERGTATRRRTEVLLAPAARVSGNTYHGRFPASYWQRWTDVREVRVELVVTGSGTVCVSASDLGGFARTVAQRTVVRAERACVEVTVGIDRFQDGGALWLDLESAADAGLRVQDVAWTVHVPPARRTASMATCTHERPASCTAILNALADDPVALARLDRVRIIDQSANPLTGYEPFRTAAARLGDRLVHVVQPNLGSAGGFNRALFDDEGLAGGAGAGILLVDDDIVLEPEVVVRLTAFADHATTPLLLGGQMLNSFHPHVLLADAQQTDIDGIQPGVPVPHGRIDVDLLARDAGGRPAMQERRLETGYNAWWTLLVPAEAVREAGLILPVFCTAEDAEYCYRAARHGFPTVTLPGAGIWHPDFALADDDGPKLYFIRRNYLILSALHGELPAGALTRRFCGELARDLLSMRYGLAETVLSAIEHFLDGPEDLHDGGATRMARILRDRSAHPDTIRHSGPAAGGVPARLPRIQPAGPPPRHPLWCGLRRLAGHLLGRGRADVGEILFDQAHWWHLSRFRTAVVTDASQTGVRVLRRDRGRLLRLGWRAARTMVRLRLTARRTRRAYLAAQTRLAGRENWARLYGQDSPEPSPIGELKGFPS